MASVDFEKVRSIGELKERFCMHNDKDERVKHSHTNKHINPELSWKNVQLHGSYSEVCAAIDARLDWLDSQENANRRKDRIIGVALEIPIPKDLDRSRCEEWFRAIADDVADLYGEENIMQSCLHCDEIHDYYDVRTEEWTESREHAHFVLIPEVDGKLCARKFTSRANMRKLNQAIHKTSWEEFGVEFMDGTGRKSNETVEELKNMSRMAEERLALEADKAALEAEAARLHALQISLEKQNEALERERQELKRTKDKLKTDREALQNEREGLQNEREGLQDALQKKFEVEVSSEVKRRTEAFKAAWWEKWAPVVKFKELYDKIKEMKPGVSDQKAAEAAYKGVFRASEAAKKIDEPETETTDKKPFVPSELFR